MIVDRIENAKFYFSLGKKIQEGLNYIQNTDLKSKQNGKYEISGEDIFVNIQDYNTKNLSEGKFEAHRRYIDIQYIIIGEEKLGYTNIQNCKSLTEYDKENDIEFLKGEGSFIHATEGMFLIFTPEDAHMPSISLNNSTYVKKAVVKVSIE